MNRYTENYYKIAPKQKRKEVKNGGKRYFAQTGEILK